jgi:glutathione reductase (NADPH)
MPYDLVAIGTGVAASVAACQCRAAGWQVAVIDHLPFGGTCALRGCNPKKVLVSAAEVVDFARRMRGKGVAGAEPAIDWHALMTFKRSFTDPVPAMKEKSFADADIDAYHGRACFRNPRSVEVAGHVLESRFILIATGNVPTHLGIEGEEHLITSTEFLDLEDLPQRIVLVGGGYIAAEFSHIASRAGARVTVLQRSGRMLKAFDVDLVHWLMQKSRDIEIEVRLNTRVERVEKRSDEYVVHATADGAANQLVADMVVHAGGRVPDIETLDLQTAGVETESGRLKLNEYLQSVSNPAVYAAGDAASKGPPLTPVAAHDAGVVAENMLNGNRRKPNYVGVPSVVFTIPPLASVGLTEEKAHAEGFKFRMKMQKASDWFTARHVAEPTYGFKILVEERTDRILGAHLVGPHADEVINVFALAIRHGLRVGALKETLFSYPTSASDIGYMLT